MQVVRWIGQGDASEPVLTSPLASEAARRTYDDDGLEIKRGGGDGLRAERTR